MELTARLTADAQVATTKSNKQVVNFTVAHNEYYKPKGGERVQQTEYIKCAYWLNPELAQYLKKGTLVEISGRLGVNAYNNAQGEARANMTCHVNTIKLHGRTQAHSEATTKTEPVGKPKEDDLPF